MSARIIEITSKRKRSRLSDGNSHFTVLKTESQQEFDSFLAALRDENQPRTPTEALLVDRMARHHWLGRRAVKLQTECLAGKNPQSRETEKNLRLFLNYQVTNDRAFSQCLKDLRKLKSEKRKLQDG